MNTAAPSAGTRVPESYVVLVHGFMRRGDNMRYLAGELEKRGHSSLAPTLPTIFQDVKTCGELLFQYLKDHLAGGDDRRFSADREIHHVKEMA